MDITSLQQLWTTNQDLFFWYIFSDKILPSFLTFFLFLGAGKLVLTLVRLWIGENKLSDIFEHWRDENNLGRPGHLTLVEIDAVAKMVDKLIESKKREKNKPIN